MTTLSNFNSNLSKVTFNSVYPTDKIIRGFWGTFRYGTDTITRSYTLAGFPNNQQVYRFAHNLGRPGFSYLQWSLDNTTFWEGGGVTDGSGHYAISFCDDTYCYIMLDSLISSGTTIYTKGIISWIDDYDTTNPNVSYTSALPTQYTEMFDSRNHLPSIVQSGVLSLSTASSSLTSVVATASHSIGYAPPVKAFIEAFSGEVWPLNYGGTQNRYLVDDNQMEAEVFTNSSQIITVGNIKSSMGTRRVWYNLYADVDSRTTASYSSGTL